MPEAEAASPTEDSSSSYGVVLCEIGEASGHVTLGLGEEATSGDEVQCLEALRKWSRLEPASLGGRSPAASQQPSVRGSAMITLQIIMVNPSFRPQMVLCSHHERHDQPNQVLLLGSQSRACQG